MSRASEGWPERRHRSIFIEFFKFSASEFFVTMSWPRTLRRHLGWRRGRIGAILSLCTDKKIAVVFVTGPPLVNWSLGLLVTWSWMAQLTAPGESATRSYPRIEHFQFFLHSPWTRTAWLRKREGCKVMYTYSFAQLRYFGLVFLLLMRRSESFFRSYFEWLAWLAWLEGVDGCACPRPMHFFLPAIRRDWQIMPNRITIAIEKRSSPRLQPFRSKPFLPPLWTPVVCIAYPSASLKSMLECRIGGAA